MSYQAVPTVATGDMWTADQHNTYIKNNFAALWPYTTIGDMAYATSATTLGVISAGTGVKGLFVSSGLPAFLEPTFNRKFCYLKRTSNQNVSNSTKANISFSTEVYDNNNFWVSGSPTVITLSTAGIYRLDGYVRWNESNSGRRDIYFSDGTNDYTMDSRSAISSIYTCASFSYAYYAASVPVNMYLRVYQNSGGSLSVNYCELMVTYMGAV